MALKNLILDMGNVLLTWEPRVFALRAAGNEQDARMLQHALFNTAEWHLHDAGQLTEEELLQISLLRTPLHLQGRLTTLFEQWPRWMAPIPGSDPLMIKAREAGLRLYLLSNAGTRFPKVLEERDFYPWFDGMMVSAHEKVSKPDLRIYWRICERFDLNPGECLFVDDLAENVEGAVKAGMAAHRFDGDFQKLEDKLRVFGVALS